jgi:S-(hydroxymethyl)glutathione dehydrogenase/alcohol dehydrogenase
MLENRISQTKAAILYQVNEPLKIVKLKIPELLPGQVLVKVIFSGICRSQLNEIKGDKGFDRYLPHTLGHEGAGLVMDVGSGVKKVKPGDQVILTWLKGEGADIPSAVYYDEEGRKINSGAISTFMEYAVISENRLVKINSLDIRLDEASLFGCALSTGIGTVLNDLKAKEDDSIVILGTGGIGIGVIIGARIARCKEIIAVDIIDWKLETTKKFGATQTINAKENNVNEIVMQLTDRKGVDFVVECAGKRETMEKGLELIHNKGTVLLAGNLPHNVKISIDPLELIKGKKIIGSWGGGTKPDKDISVYIERVKSLKFNLNELISHRFKLGEINQAFEKLEDGSVARALIDFT